MRRVDGDLALYINICISHGCAVANRQQRAQGKYIGLGESVGTNKDGTIGINDRT